MFNSDKNVITVSREDKSFIRAIMSLPPEQKILIQGFLLGMEFQGKQNKTAGR